MIPELEELRVRVGNFILFFVPAPTKNGKFQPRIKQWAMDAMVQDERISLTDIPKEVMKVAYRKAAVVMNKWNSF
jgi:hypothetical protein